MFETLRLVTFWDFALNFWEIVYHEGESSWIRCSVASILAHIMKGIMPKGARLGMIRVFVPSGANHEA
ncbi:hypothetical protein C9J03_05980 [Photobacterium gaetbulicola]|nr:hypothetical protein C9J03_05980 [Photobacterium gaetbulicola]